MALIGSVSGSHTKLADGATYIEAGSNITIVSGSGDSITIAGTNTTYTAGDGLDLSGTAFSTDLKSGGGLKIDTTELAIDNSVVATLTGSQFSGNMGVTGSISADKGTFTSDLSGSLQALADGTAYLRPGNVNITIASASAGYVSISSTDTNTTYTAGDGLDLSGTVFSTDLKTGSGLIIDTTELSIDHAIIPATSGAIFSGDVGITGSLSTTGHAEVGALEVGGGYGSTGVTITGAGAINLDSFIKVGGGAIKDFAGNNNILISDGNTTISGDLTVVGNDIAGDFGNNISFSRDRHAATTEYTQQTTIAGELHVSGAIGICVTPNSESTDEYWVKFATANFGTATYAGTAAIFFVQLIGRYDGYYASNAEAAMIYVSLNNSGHSTGPHFTVDLIGQIGKTNQASFPDMWDLENFVLTYNTTDNTAEIWIQALQQNASGTAKLYGTQVSGGNRNGFLAGGDWWVETNQTWASSFTSLGTDQVGTYRSFTMDQLRVSGSVESLYFNGFEKIKSNSNLTERNGIYWPSSSANNEAANTLLEASNQLHDVLGPSVSSTSTYWYSVQAVPADDAGNVRRHTDGSSANNFTGQHNALPASGSGIVENLVDNVGLIVRSIGEYCRFDEPSQSWVSGSEGITISEALPRVELTIAEFDKSVFGVVSNMPNEYLVDMDTGQYEQDQDGVAKGFGNIAQAQVRINALGEGAIWVVNTSGNLENGDYITTSALPGYGMKQADDLLHNYTVAKITLDCSFDVNSTEYNCEEIVIEDQTYLRAFVGCTYHCG